MTPWASTRAILSLVGEASHALAHARSASELADALQVPLLEVMEISWACLAFVKPHADDFVAYGIGEPEGRAPLAGGPVSALHEPPRSAFWKGHDVCLLLPIPTANGRGIWGALVLGPKRTGSPFDADDTDLLGALCDQLGLALENTYCVEQLSLHKHALLAFFSGIVHEASNPLGALRSSMETFESVTGRLCSNSDPDAERLAVLLGGARACVETSRRSTERLSALVQALKEYVNLEEAEASVVDLCRIVRDALCNDPGAQVELRLPKQPALTVACPRKLHHVVRGLIDNARQASADRQRVFLELSREGERWRLVVRDQGRGMSPETVAQAFDVGFCTKGGRVGLRLGLPYTKQVMDEIGGEVRITSTPGAGTAVSLVFPLPTGPSHQCEVAKQPPASQGSGGATLERPIRPLTSTIPPADGQAGALPTTAPS